MTPATDSAERRRELLRAKLAARPLRGTATDHRIRSQARPSGGPVSWPLTSTQRRMWFLQQLDSADTSATLCRALRLHGPTDVTSLRHAARELVARHEVLRSTFHADGAEPVQRVGVVPEEVLTVLDLPGTDPAEAAEQLAHRCAGTSFDLAAETPLRLVLARLGDDDHLLMVVVHHVACDDASWRILMDQLAALYRGEIADGERLQVGDVAVWQRDRAGGPAEREELLYWRERLEGLAAPVALQPDHRAGGEPEVGWCSAELGDQVDAAVREHGTRSGATPFAVLYSALLVVLHRRTGATDLAVGSPVTGRSRAELDGVVGDFGNTVVLRTSVADDPGFATLLDRARDVVTGALTHQDVAFDTVVERMAPTSGRSGLASAVTTNLHRPSTPQLPAGRTGDRPEYARYEGRSPARPAETWNADHPANVRGQRTRADALFRIMFLTYDDRFADGHPFGPSVEVSEVRTPAHASQFDLTVAMSRGTHGLHAESTFRADLYTENTVGSVFEQMAVVLTEALTRPDLPISRLPLADAESVASRAVPARQPAPPVTDTSRLQPRAVSVTGRTQSVTADELAERAERIARALVVRGAGPGRAVVVALPPSPDMVAAQLAIHQVGAVHVPVDPRHPPARTELVVEGVNPLVVVTDHEVADQLGTALGEAERLFVEDLGEGDPGPMPQARPDDAAYVIHTSGSTGRPKGVVVTRANLASMLEATDAALPVALGPADVWSVTHSAAFDFSVWEIWGAMAHGSRLVLVDHDTVREPRALAELLVEEGVTVLSQTPSAFAGLVAADAEDPELLAGSALRLIVFGGEPLEPELVRRWYARHPHDGPLLVNMFGITETTVHASAVVMDPSTVERLPGGASGTPIGQALPGQWLDVVDPTGRPVPTGVLGELWVGGPGVSRGYLGDPVRTAERFVSGPDGTRFYRSGDRARRGPDGGLLHLGRIDDQISLRGYRIEPGEVAAAVAGATGASDVAVLVVERAGDPRLVAFVATDAVDPARLRATLSGRLTEPMIPSEFFAVDRLPLTTSGKVDRRALAELAATRAEEVGSRRTPEGPTEQTVAALFADVLGVPETSVGADDDFFTLGGHSLLAVRLASALRSSFDADVDVRTVFDAATVAGIAEVVTSDDGIVRPALAARERPEHLPVAELAHGLWFLNRVDPLAPTYHVPIEIHLRGQVDTEALGRALRDVVARHESLRTIYPRGGAAEQVVLPDAPIEITEHTEITDELLEVPFDLAAAPPVRLLLAPRDGGMTGVLLLHHIAADEGSLAPLLSDLGTAYTARSQGRAPEWTPLPVQYADWSLWHRELLGDDPSSERDRQREYWARTLAGAPERLELPLDRPRPATRDTAGSRVPVRVEPELRRAVGRLAAAHGVSTFMVLHAALATLLTRFGAGEDITVGSPVGRRTEPALNGMVGYLVNTVVLRTDTGGDPSFAELLGRVRKVALDAYANADLPFEQVVNAVAPGRSTAATPLFQVLLSYAAGALPTPGFGDLDVTVAPRATATAKFDLTLNLAEHPDADGAAAIDGVLAFRTDVFDRTTVDRMAAVLPRILSQVTVEPERSIGDLDILGDDVDRILRDWNDTQEPIPADDVVTQIAKAAAADPAAPAVVSADGAELTYRELVDGANRLAHLLRERLGIAEGERYVGLLLPRSPALVTALVGVLASDAAFVPIDAGLPAARVAELCGSLDAVVTDTATRHLLDGVPDVPTIVLDAVTDELAGQPVEPPRRRTGTETPNGLRAAYVIHTSGSTGVPKSAVIVHDAIASRMTWQRAKLGLTPDDGVLHKAPLTFDISVNELLLPLTAGARLVLAEPGRHGDLAHLLDVIDRNRVSFVYLVASMLEVMLETPSVAQRARSLRHLWCGGEKLTAELLMRTREALDVTLYHGYGPAETTIGVCSETHPAGERGEIAEVTLGRPNPNTVLYVLDRRLRPVPPGVGGELYVGGILLGRGYRGDPARTAERFVPDPFGTGGRLYATGDLARYRADGRLEFLGRADNQVKVRGARVELEEVESVLRGHPRVRQAASVLLDPGPSARLAVAWVPEPGPAAPDRDEVLGWLRDRLPASAVPSVLSAVPELPLRTSGKVDRALVSSWLVETERAHALSEPVDPPRGDQEELVAKVWSDVLGLPLDQVGARSGFFDLGGNSLSMVVVQQRLAEEIGQEPALLDLLAHPTVADLARLLSGPDEPTVDPALSRARERAARTRQVARRRRS